MMDVQELLAKWDSGDGKPYKGSLIDWKAYEADPANIGCMCAQGQALHLLGGWSPEKLSNAEQSEADRETAKLLNISIAHSILLRSVNDKADGAPSVVLTHPEKVLGDQAQIVVAFWLHMDRMTAKDWDAAWDAARDAARAAAGDAARAAAGDAAWAAAGAAAWAAAWDAARAAAWAAARAAAWDAAWAAARAADWDAAGAAAGDAAWAAAYACSEIQGARIMREKGQPFYFLPIFGFADPESIPPLPADYGRAA